MEMLAFQIKLVPYLTRLKPVSISRNLVTIDTLQSEEFGIVSVQSISKVIFQILLPEVCQLRQRLVWQSVFRHEVAYCLFEDAAYRDLYYQTPWPAESTLSMPAFSGFPVLYLGTFDKPFASGLKSGFGICNHKEWISNMLHAKGHQDFGSSNFVQALLEDIVDTEDYGIYVSGLRIHYESKAALVQEVLEAEGLTHKGWRWENPSGGLYFWLEGPKGLDTSIGSDFCEACRQ